MSILNLIIRDETENEKGDLFYIQDIQEYIKMKIYIKIRNNFLYKRKKMIMVFRALRIIYSSNM